MVWTDPKNKRFLTTGWAMFVVGWILLAIRSGSVGTITAYVGLVLIGMALIVWVVKAMECIQRTTTAARPSRKKPAAKAKASKPKVTSAKKKK